MTHVTFYSIYAVFKKWFRFRPTFGAFFFKCLILNKQIFLIQLQYKMMNKQNLLTNLHFISAFKWLVLVCYFCKQNFTLMQTVYTQFNIYISFACTIYYYYTYPWTELVVYNIIKINWNVWEYVRKIHIFLLKKFIFWYLNIYI